MGFTCYIEVLVLLAWMTVVKGDCPIARCTCLSPTPPATERIIDCRDKDLQVFPIITASNEIFMEITFNSANYGCRETNPPSCSNNITHIPNNAFAGLKVRKIDFGRSILATVDDGAFQGLETLLTDLILEGDGTSQVPFVSLTHLTNLVSLTLESFTLENNGLMTLPQDFPNLEKLVLHSLNLNFLAENSVIGKLQKLKRIEIIGNQQLTTYPVGVLRQLTTLEHIRIVQNGIRIIQSAGSAFENHANLKEIDLSHNEISDLQSDCFKHMDSRLTYLSLALNYLTDSSLQTLKTGNWQNLEQLILDSNTFNSGLPQNLFQNMINLANLNLQQTRLLTIEENTLNGLQNLHSLHLSGNDDLQIREGSFYKTPNLRELYLDVHQFTNHKFNFSSDTAAGLTNLERLELHQRNLEAKSFWNSLQKMPKLKFLKLSNTGLSTIPDLAFQYSTKLESLEMDSNGLTQLTQSQIHGLGNSLLSLQLAHNSITSIDECVVQEWKLLKAIYLLENPLYCDCKLLELYHWSKQKQANDTNFKYILNARCSNMGNNYLLNLTSNDLVCDPGTQPVTCQTFTTSTTTMTPSTTPVTTLPLPDIVLSIDSRNKYNLQISWTVSGTVHQFYITQEELGSGVPPTQTAVDSINRQWTLQIKDHTDYRICIQASTSDNRNTVPVCKDSLGHIVSTQGPTESPQTGLSPGEVAAIGGGTGLMIVLIVVILFFLIRYQNRPKYKDTPPVQFTAVARPTTGYDSKRFSKPKRSPQANGDLIISAISSGKTEPSSPDSRHSAGSYQHLNENQMVDIQPHLKYQNGAHGVSNHHQSNGYYNKQPEIQGYLKEYNAEDKHGHLKGVAENRSNSRYDKTPSQQNGLLNKKAHSYANDTHNTSVYTNDINNRPLPKPQTKHYENNSAGFLNHGFDLDSPTENTYSEIPETTI